MVVERVHETGQLDLRFDVEDTGIGVAKEDQGRIFDAFTQVGKGVERGTGLGLAIAKQFVELMGGAISVKSVLGKGSRFSVALQVSPAPDLELAGTATGEPLVRLEPGQPDYRVLIVEDDGANRTLLERLLKKAGFSVRVAADGARGIEIFRDLQPHLIWMDLRMPGMDGLEATQKIRALAGGRDVKIVALTASASQTERQTVLAAGMDDFLGKPYRSAGIFDCMARHLGLRYAASESVPASVEQLPVALAPETLAALPEEIREQLRSAVIALNVKRIADVIRRVEEREPALGAALTVSAKRFAFTAILRALEAGVEGSPAPQSGRLAACAG